MLRTNIAAAESHRRFHHACEPRHECPARASDQHRVRRSDEPRNNHYLRLHPAGPRRKLQEHLGAHRSRPRRVGKVGAVPRCDVGSAHFEFRAVVTKQFTKRIMKKFGGSSIMTSENNSTRREQSFPAQLMGPAAIGRFRIRSLRAPLLALAALALLATPGAHAQITAQFFATQLPVPTSGLNYPYRVALDSSGNLYISDTQNSRVLKETPLPNGDYAQTIVAQAGLATPYGIAVDSQGNVFIADNGHNRVLEETPSGSTYVESVMPTSTLSYPTGVAVDSLDNVYIADTAPGRGVQAVPGSAN